MTSYKLIIEASFERGLKSLPPDRAKAVAKSLILFRENPELPRFRYRSLKGLSGYFIINVKHGDRIILRKDDETTYAAVDVGPHDNVYRCLNRR
ncbi:hypothetical protein GRI33_07115 [Brucella sp. BO3]|uniref:type II toxin-antitoxin system RelE family toxin n=1 Tax=Brucella sp. BO3 TaxID=2691913 RepID=UPI00084FB672|nr:hypothetical protein [Brucella sp. BO3]OEI85076.1 hypothetical protein BA060_00260 [Brucella sp. B13-0095]QMV26705.1 hypothetical protein GRI33_07115 [Brucella sp. BO3]